MAAGQLGLSQSGLSRAIGRLEATLGVKLLQRNTRNVALTPDGRQFVEQVAPLLAGLDDDAPVADKLTTYRSMRDATKTPEPVPRDIPVRGNNDRFVIQEHHARRLHYDLRLERDGVLVSWAVPKNLPDTTAVNHLAVHTEDHPIEYLTFHGTIPKGEYGAGSMTVWDTGTYETEKWRDDEVIVTLTGRPGGPLGGPVRVAGVGVRSRCNRSSSPVRTSRC